MRENQPPEKNPQLEASNHYWVNLENLVRPFIYKSEEPSDNLRLAKGVAIVLDYDEDLILKALRSSDQSAAIISSTIREVAKGLKENLISKDAPWFKKLEDQMLALSLFVASASVEMDLAKGGREFLNTVIEDLRKK